MRSHKARTLRFRYGRNNGDFFCDLPIAYCQHKKIRKLLTSSHSILVYNSAYGYSRQSEYSRNLGLLNSRLLNLVKRIHFLRVKQNANFTFHLLCPYLFMRSSYCTIRLSVLHLHQPEFDLTYLPITRHSPVFVCSNL